MITPNTFLYMKNQNAAVLGSKKKQPLGSRIVEQDVIIRVFTDSQTDKSTVKEKHKIRRTRTVNALTDTEVYFYFDSDGDLIYAGGDYTMKGKGKFGYRNYVERNLPPALRAELFPVDKVCNCTDCKNCSNDKEI